MQLHEKFRFGQYKSLSLKEVYQGSSAINKKLLNKFLNHCLNDNNMSRPNRFEFCDFLITEDEIIVLPHIFSEEKKKSIENVVWLGDISEDISYYFSSFFRKNWYGIIETFEKFNQRTDSSVIGGDPEYINWCIHMVEGFEVKEEVKVQLELLEINRLLGISVNRVSKDRYTYSPIINKYFYRFS